MPISSVHVTERKQCAAVPIVYSQPLPSGTSLADTSENRNILRLVQDGLASPKLFPLTYVAGRSKTLALTIEIYLLCALPEDLDVESNPLQERRDICLGISSRFHPQISSCTCVWCLLALPPSNDAKDSLACIVVHGTGTSIRGATIEWLSCSPFVLCRSPSEEEKTQMTSE